MPDLSPHERGIQIGLEVTRRTQGVQITYTRGGTSLTVKNALQGYTRKTVIEVSGREQVVEAQEWLVAVDDISSLSPPAVGDLIVRVINGTTYTFTVEVLDTGEPHWDWSDVAKTQYRITTRKDGASAFEVTKPNGFDLAGDELRY